jgi:glycosyltransferase involved in cell wall biosynthesis
MADRRLLILTYHFPPSAAAGAFRTLGFVRHLPRFGWQAVVVAPPRLPYEPTDEALLGRVPPEAVVYRIPYPERLIWKPIRRFFPFGIWLPFAALRCYRAIRAHRPNAVLTSGPPHAIHLLGRHLRRWAGLPWVADFRDPWVAGDRSAMHPNPHPWERRGELSVMREADAVVVNTPGASDLMCRAYPQYAAKVTAITNGYDPEPFEANPIPPLSGPTIEIVHTGVIYASRSPGPFLEAVRGLDSAALAGRGLRVRLIGNILDQGPKDEIADQVGQGLNASVCLEDRVPYPQAVRAMVQADLLLLLDTPGRRAGVPAKLYEYIGAGRPILALAEPESDVAWVLRESGLPHRVAPPRDPQAIRSALSELLQDPTTARGAAAHRPISARFTREHLTGELASLLDSCLDRPSRAAGERLLSEPAR